MSDTVISTVARAGGPQDAAAREKRFFFFFALLIGVTVFIGFSPSYFLKDVIHAPPALSAMTRVHGAIFTAWVLLFITQVALIDLNKPALHRRLGLVGAVLFGTIVAVGVMTALNAGRLGHAPPGVGAPLVFMVVPLAGIAAVAVLVLLAFWNRAQRPTHMRYMLASFIAMTPPATHRIFLGAGFPAQALMLSFGLMDALLLVAILYDLRLNKRLHPAYLWSAAAFVASEVFIVWAYATPAWLSAASWLIQT